MLAALCVTEPRRRWMSIKRRPPIVRSEFVTAGSGRYLKITAERRRDGQLDWAGIRHAASREASRLLLPRGLIPPENSRVGDFHGRALARELMKSTGLALLDAIAVNPRLVQVSIYDPKAETPDLPLAFLPKAADVRVITMRPERYERQQYVAMESYGAVLMVTNETSSLKGSLVLLAPDGLPNADEVNLCGRGLILSVGGNETMSTASEPQCNAKGIIDGYIPRVAHSLLATLPEGCDVEKYLAGLYELSGVKEIAEQPPEFLHMGGHTITLRDAAWRLAGIDIGISV